MSRIIVSAVLCAVSAVVLSAQTKTITDKACHVTVPADWKPVGPHSASAPGTKTFTAVVKSITPDDVKATVDAIKQGQLGNYRARVLDEDAKRVSIQSEAKSSVGKLITHYQVMTKAAAACQGSVDFDDPADAAAARKIVDSTTGAK